MVRVDISSGEYATDIWYRCNGWQRRKMQSSFVPNGRLVMRPEARIAREGSSITSAYQHKPGDTKVNEVRNDLRHVTVKA